MRKNILFILTFSFSFLFAQEKLEKSLLWKISGKNIETSYLFGTMHATCETNLSQNVINAISQTKDIYLELDLDDSNLQMNMMQHMNMKNGETIKNLISEKDYQLLDAFLIKELGMGLSAYNTIKPFFISTMFITKFLDCPMQSIETSLMAQAKKEKEEVYGLETVEDQVAAFESIPYKEQAQELVKFAKEGLQKSKKEFKELMEIYKSEDIEKMLAISFQKEDNMFKKHIDALLTNRNKNWIQKIVAISTKNKSFYGVGAAHLAGEYGVINLLRKRGFKVEAVR